MMRTSSPADAKANPRIAALVRRFDALGQSEMRDLPLYNPALAVEAVGFRYVHHWWIGVLITPWFMSLIRLPEDCAPMDLATIGRKVRVALPSGKHELMQGGDDVVGAYQSLSLHSPMLAFRTQDAARNEAVNRLHTLLEYREEPLPDNSGRLHAEPQKLSRRAFLRGPSGGSAE